MRFSKSKNKFGFGFLVLLFVWGILVWLTAKENRKTVLQFEYGSPALVEESEPENVDLDLLPDYVYRLDDMPEDWYYGIDFYDAEPWALTDKERHVVCAMVAGEAGNQSYYGKWLVATCIRNACFRSQIQPHQVRIEYQYSGWNEHFEYQYPNVWLEVEEIVNRVFEYGDLAVDDEILWFYNPEKSKGKFHNTQRFVVEEGNHRFYAPIE